MTLTNPNSPNINETVANIVAHTQENLSYLDTEPAAYAISYFTRVVGAGDGYHSVSGVGFEPRVIILFGISTYGGFCIGYYGPSSGVDEFNLRKRRTATDGIFTGDQWGFVPGFLAGIFNTISAAGITYGNLISAQVYLPYNDGYVLYFNETYAQIAESYYFISLCIK
jgi:hypothetical protein